MPEERRQSCLRSSGGRTLLYLLFLLFLIPFPAHSDPAPKNIILIIGDGFGPQELGLGALYARYGKEFPRKDRRLAIERLMERGTTGVQMTTPVMPLVTDSACATSQLATGARCLPGSMGFDGDGNRVRNITERAKAAGLAVGLISDTRATHATPASFAIHAENRFDEGEVAKRLIESPVDLLLSGGRDYFEPVFDRARENGFTVISRGDDLKKIVYPQRVLGLFAPSGMPDAIDYAARSPHR